MLRIRTGARHGLRGAVFGFATFIAVLIFTTTAGQAAPYSDIVVDANSGSVLHATNPDARRHPASLTKIMTLYLLFEQLEVGKLKLDTALKVSAEAAGQSPTKLGLKAGTTIAVEDAIKGIITRSANDAAVVVAEAIAGDEEEFAQLMTRKARALGMSRTVYKNASGLPDDDQVTTVRDQAILGRAVQERFPKYYKYFSLRSFTFRGQSIGNHNRLLGRVEGVDGIKTGYIRASGFNLVSSVRRGNRHIVAVVIGGSSASSRDARMRELISDNIASASNKPSAPVIAEAADTRPDKPDGKAEAKPPAKPGAKVAAKPEPKPEPKDKSEVRFAVASTAGTPARLASAAAGSAASEGASPRTPPGSTEPIKPVLVRTVTVRTPPPAPAAAATSAVPALDLAAFQPIEFARIATLQGPAAATVPAKPPAPAPASAAAVIKSELPSVTRQLPAVEPAAAIKSEPVPPVGRTESVAITPVRDDASAPLAQVRPASPATFRTAAAEPVPARTEAAPKHPARSGWVIQIGAYPAEQEAKQRLSAVQSKAAKILEGADPFTETVEKGGTTYYRARFAGFDKDKAEAACKYLKRNDVDCMIVKN
jgi:D-alanyl-D-alanine carboxypeptidase